jgi:lipopolysaccharide biosynthesis glycosyltransferase
MNIICTIDNNYIRHCAVMLSTLREANPDEDLSVYIVHEALEPKERAKLVGYLGEFLPSVSLLQVEPRLLSHFPVSGHISIATYFRLLLPSILPPILNRALFIDSDVVINGSLRELWETPFEGHSLAAVTDRNLDMQRERLEMDADSPYFNAGMMLIDLEAWRRANVLERGMAYAIENRDKLNNWDQDVLNHLFEKRVLLLHQRWNAMSHLWGLDQAWMEERGGLLNPEEQQAHDGPAIIHFAGGGRAKPWDYRCNNPWKDRYRQFLAQSPWAGVPLDGQPEEISSNLVKRALAKASRTIRGTP